MPESLDQLTTQAAFGPSALIPAVRGFLSLIASRLTFAYLLLYCYFGLGIIPFIGNWLTGPIERGWRIICSWVAVHAFHLSGPVTQYHPTGSGDTTLEYVRVFCYAILAAFAAVIWTLLDRSERRNQILYPWVRLVVRFYLAAYLLIYGAMKVCPLQFSAPDFTRLSETFGEASPMGLLWTFMGASPYYQMFSGWAEVAPGLLLLFRRTSTAGALIAVAVMGNVVALNFCYDVPVKLFSLHLLLMAVFLLIPDMKPLWSFLILRQTCNLQGIWVPRFERRALRIATLVFQVLIIGNTVYAAASSSYGSYKMMHTIAAQTAPLMGVWELDNAAHSESGWRRVTVPLTGRFGVRMEDGSLLRFVASQNEKKHSVHLKGWRNDHFAQLTYQLPDKEHLVLTGTIDGTAVELHFHHVDPQQFLLATRGFHWISEDPYNL